MIKPQRVNLLINTQNKKDCGKSYLETVSFQRNSCIDMKQIHSTDISISNGRMICIINYGQKGK